MAIRPVHAALPLSTAGVASAVTLPDDSGKMRASAEHECYDGTQALCLDVTSNDEEVRGCMKAHHAQLSPNRAEGFDAGMS